MPAITSNFELADAAERNNIRLVGIFFKNALPDHVAPGGYIFNLADENPGTHWTGGWVEGKRVVYFDPFGFPAPEKVKHFFRSVDRSMLWSDIQVQNVETAICGYYVLLFLWFMAHQRGSVGDKFEKFKKLWSPEPEENRRRLEEYLKSLN